MNVASLNCSSYTITVREAIMEFRIQSQCLQSNRDKYRAVIPKWFTNGTRQQYNNGEFAVDDNTNNADHIKNEKL